MAVSRQVVNPARSTAGRRPVAYAGGRSSRPNDEAHALRERETVGAWRNVAHVLWEPRRRERWSRRPSERETASGEGADYRAPGDRGTSRRPAMASVLEPFGPSISVDRVDHRGRCRLGIRQLARRYPGSRGARSPGDGGVGSAGEVASARALNRSNASGHIRARNALSSARPSGRVRYRRRTPVRRSVRSPQSLRIVRCWEMAVRVTGKCAAMSPAAISSSATSRRMARRRGSAIARRTSSVGGSFPLAVDALTARILFGA